MTPNRISFARTLPILALLLSYIAVAVPVTMAYINLRHATRYSHDVILQSHQIGIRVPHDHVLRFSLQLVALGTSDTIQAVNLPGHFIEFAIAKCASNSWRTWSPFHWDVFAWRAFSFPVCCLPFWWLAGVGVDGILQRHRLRWWHFVPGLILWAFFLMWVSVFYFGFSALERTEGVYPIWSVWLWLVLLSTFPVTWVRQWLASRATRAGAPA